MKNYFDLTGQVAIVTGCSTGLGVQMAKALANQGATIVALARRKEKIEEVAKEIGEKILSIYTNKVDLQKELQKILGEPSAEYKKGRSITGSRWEVPLKEKSKISKLILKANIFEL